MHHFLICTLTFSFKRPLDGCFPLRQLHIRDENIIFGLLMFYLRPLFQEQKYGVKTGFWCTPN